MLEFSFNYTRVPLAQPGWSRDQVRMGQRAAELFDHAQERLDILSRLDGTRQDEASAPGRVRTATGDWVRFDPASNTLEAGELTEHPLVGGEVKLALQIDDQGPVLTRHQGWTTEKVRWNPEGTMTYLREEQIPSWARPSAD